MRISSALLCLFGLVISMKLLDLFFDWQQDVARQEQTFDQQLAQIALGGDPSKLLAPTASGGKLRCNTENIYYGQSANGYRFIRDYGGWVYATRINGKLVCQQADPTGRQAHRCIQRPDDFARLSQAYIACSSSDTEPVPSGIAFVF